MRTRVANALTGAAAGGASGGTCVSMPKMMGMTVTEMSMMTVPPTMGVMTRRSQGEPPGKEKLEQRGGDDQRCQQGRAALDQGGDAHGDEGAGGAHQQDVTGADVPHPARLDDGRHAAHYERRERRPGEQRVTQPGGANHDGGREHDAGDGEHGVLQAETEGERAGWVFVRLVADL